MVTNVCEKLHTNLQKDYQEIISKKKGAFSAIEGISLAVIACKAE